MAPPALARLHAACEGNPLLALELVRAPGAEAASDIRRLLAARVGALAPETRTVLRFVAALAEPTLGAVEAAVDAPGGLEEALAADVLVRDGSRLRFSHPLIGAVVEERTPLGEWRAIHARLAELTNHPEQRARHLAAAADGPDEAVAAVLEAAAGEAATRGAMMAAADLAERAAELTPSTDQPVRLRRLLDAAEAAMAVGDGPRARGPLDEVLARAGAGPLRAAALHKLAYVVMDDSALQLTEAALDEAGTDEALLAEVHLTASMFAAMGGDRTALRHADAAVRHAEATGQPFLLSKALSNIAFLRHCAGGGVQRELLLRADALERAESVAGRDDTPLEVLGMQLYVNGDLAESRELLTAELERAHGARLSRARELRDYCCSPSSRSARGAGSSRRASRGRRSSSRSGRDLWNAEAAGHCTVAVVDAHLGRVASAREHAETGRRQATDLGDLGFATKCSHILGFLALSLGDPEGAVLHLAPLRANEAQLNIREPAMFCIGPDAAEALVLAGDLDAAREVQAELEARGRTLGRAWAIATACAAAA